MINRGARYFVFMGRSGTDRQTAKLLVEEITRVEVNVKVTRGNACNADPIATAMRNVDTTVGGIIQAAENLKESLFSKMNVSDWHLGLTSLVKGTWNLHHNLRGLKEELDFFGMTSSVTGSIGQDRRSLGLRGTSVALGAVKGIGYLAEHPEAEMMLQRQGFRAIDEEELLQLIDLAMSGCQNQSGSADATIEHPNILTGLDEQNCVQRVMEDPRASILAPVVSRLSLRSNGAADAKDSALPEPVMGALPVGDNKVLYNVVTGAVAGKLARLIQTPAEQITAQTKHADIGMDSMLAVEAAGSDSGYRCTFDGIHGDQGDGRWHWEKGG